MANLFRKNYSRGWQPSADAVNGPADCLLRADNLVLDEDGIPALRQGSSVLYTLADLDVHSLFSTNINDVIYRFAGAGSRLYLDGVDLGISSFDGTGDYSFAGFMGKVFVARGTTKKQWDPTFGVQTWGIPAPSIKPTLAAVSAVSKTFASCDSTESPAITVNEGTSSFIADSDGNANSAIQLVPVQSTGRAVMTKIYTSDSDFLNFSGEQGKDNDVFDMKIALSKPEDIRKVTVMVGLGGSAADPFRDDYYYFDFNLGDTSKQNTVRRTSAGVANKMNSTAADSAVDAIVGDDPIDIDETLTRLDKPTPREGRSRERKDSVGASPAWFHLSVPRGQFNRVGNTSGKDWSLVKAVKIICQSVKGSTGTFSFDSIQMFGGGDRIWSGSYKVRYRFVRNNGNFLEKSPFSPASDVTTFDSQAMRVTVPNAALSGLESGVNETWIYVYGGFMDRYYRVATTGTTGSTSRQRMDVFPKSPDGSVDVNDRVRHIAFGFSPPGVVSSPDLVVDISMSEIDAIINNFWGEPGCLTPPDNIISIEGDFQKRLWAMASDGFLYPSLLRNPCTFNALHAIRIGDPASVPYWVKKTTGGLYVGTSEDIFRVTGSAGENPDGTLDVRLENCNVGNPPVSSEVASEGNLIVYRSDDGFRIFSGTDSIPMPRAQVDLLWRGYTRHGVSPINKAGRFRIALQRQVLFAVTPEGGSTSSSSVLYRYDMLRQHWYRHVYTGALRNVISDPTGRVFVSDTSGRVWELDTGSQDGGVDIPVVAWTKVDDDASPNRRKDPFDLWFKGDFSSAPTVDLHLDNSGSSGLTVTGGTAGAYKKDVTSLTSFRQVQLRITGSFSSFKLYEWNLAYRLRPQTHMAVDTGYIQPPGGQRIAFVSSVDLEINTPNDVQVLLYLDDVLYVTKTITIGSDANKTVTRKVKFDRGAHGTKPRVLVKTTNSAGTGEVGFELYWLSVSYWPTGNQSEKPVSRVNFNAVESQGAGA